MKPGTLRALRQGIGLALPVVAVAIGLGAAATRAHATDADMTERNERCAARLSIALLGQGADAQLAASDNPQDAVDTMLTNPMFVERLARFLNATMNSGPAESAEDDTVYYVAKNVLTNGRPYADLFTGKLTATLDTDSSEVVVNDDAQGLGYFRSPAWLRRYAGNESQGYKLSTAYRMLNNTLGLELVASTVIPGEDRTSEGRHGAACSSCHFDNWYALDTIAKVLTKRVGTGATMKFAEPTEGPQVVLGGTTVSNDAELLSTLVGSDAFKFRTCRLAFQFMYGRAENECEAPLFDKCIDEFTAKGTIQSAVALLAKDPGYCQ